MSASCTGCDRPIFWALSENKKKMPMDAAPSTSGSFRLVDNPGENPTAVFVPENERSGQRVYTCHYATCKSPRTRAAVPK